MTTTITANKTVVNKVKDIKKLFNYEGNHPYKCEFLVDSKFRVVWFKAKDSKWINEFIDNTHIQYIPNKDMLLEIKKHVDEDKLNILFWNEGNEYKFMGIYGLDLISSIKYKKLIYKKISNEFIIS